MAWEVLVGGNQIEIFLSALCRRPLYMQICFWSLKNVCPRNLSKIWYRYSYTKFNIYIFLNANIISFIIHEHSQKWHLWFCIKGNV